MIKKVLIHIPLFLIVLCLSFYIGLQIHFPTTTLQKRLQYEVSKNSNGTLFVNIEKTEIDSLGLRFTNVQILQKERKKEEATEMLFTPYLTLSIPFFSALQGKPQANISTELFGGEFSSNIMLDTKNNLSIKPTLTNLNAALLPLYGDAWDLSFLGSLDVSGKLNFPMGKFSKAKGSLALKGNNLELKEGKVLIKTLPSIKFTQTNIEIEFEKGNANIKEGLFSSEALSLEIGGYIKLNDTPMKSKLYLTLKIETGEEINNLIGALGKPYQDADGSYNIKLLGNLSNPRFQTGNKPAKRPSPKSKSSINEESETDISAPDMEPMDDENPRVKPAQVDEEEKEKRRQERIERARERREERLQKRKTEAHGFEKVLPTPRVLSQITENEDLSINVGEIMESSNKEDPPEPSEENSNDDSTDEDEPSDE